MVSKFIHALDGLKYLLRHDTNIRLQLGLGLLTVITGCILQLSELEWLVVLILIALVVSLEVVNSCIEKICDFIHPGYHIEVKHIKDGSAAAVLVSSIIAFIAATIIFLPKIITYVDHYLSSI